MVFFRSIATVIGPTPPGTGVMCAALGLTASKSTSPTVFFVPSGKRHAIDPDVDHDRAVAHVIRADQSGFAHRDHQNLRAACVGRSDPSSRYDTA